jgi:hypothetical protein
MSSRRSGTAYGEEFMRARLVIAGVVAAAAAAAVPALATAEPVTPDLPPACVVVTAPGGVNLQVGLAPNGPSDCTRIP